MFKNYFKIAIRTIWKNKLFSAINVFGLGIAIGASILLLLTAFHEFSFDRFHQNHNQIFQVFDEEYKASGVRRKANLMAPLAPALQEAIPELEHIVRWSTSGASVEFDGAFHDVRMRYTDQDFFQLFSFKLKQGEPSSIIKNQNSAVLSERTAKRIFGAQDPVGKTIKVNLGRNYFLPLVVTGIVENQPINSTLEYDLITRIENQPNFERNRESWDNNYLSTFVQLPKNLKLAQVESRMQEVVEKYLHDETERLVRDGATPNAEGQVYCFRLMPLSDLHFQTAISKSFSRKALPIGLVLIAAFILGIACINFVNLTIGGAITRSMEVGIRKVLGASRGQIIGQFWGEALVITALALALGLTFAQLILPEFNALFRRPIQLNHPNLIFALSAVLIFIGFLGGGYPAIVLSRFKIVEVLKKMRALQKPGKIRNLLVVLQFTFSILLIICTIIVGQQLNYLRNKPLGFNQEEVLSIPLGSELDGKKVLERMRNELSSQPSIKSLTGGYRNLGLGKDGGIVTSIIGFDQGERNLSTHWITVDYDYFKTLDIPLVEGRAFSTEHPTDTLEAVVINETFAKQLTDSAALGTVLQLSQRKKVIGIAKDFHFQELGETIAPLTISMGNQDFAYNYLFVRVDANNIPATMEILEDTWKKVNPKSAFMASFLDENNDRLYRGEQAMGKIFLSASTLAIILSCMGLFGIALLVITQRTKEIGIRKVLGASISNIISLISKDFIQLVGIALILATPIAWYAMDKWLENYAYSISVQWWVFLLAGILAISIAFLTISIQSFRAATANPVKSLRNE